MAATPEKRVKDNCVAIIKAFDAYYFFPPANGFGTMGRFDIVVGYRGYFIGVETKATSQNPPTLLQSKNAAKAIQAGCVALLVHKDNTEVLRKVMEDIKHGAETGISWQSVWPFDGVIEGRFGKKEVAVCM